MTCYHCPRGYLQPLEIWAISMAAVEGPSTNTHIDTIYPPIVPDYASNFGTPNTATFYGRVSITSTREEQVAPNTTTATGNGRAVWCDLWPCDEK